MRLARIATPDGAHLAVVEGTLPDDPADDAPALDGLTVVDITAVEATFGDDVVAVLAAGDAGRDAVTAALAAAPASARRSLAEARLLAPVPRPPKFLAIGFNFRGHEADAGAAPPAFPLFFNKQTTCVTGPTDPIQAPPSSTQLDYEGELVMVIGRRCRHVPADRAAEVVGGYLVGNDVSARDWQRRSPTVTLGKSFDATAPTGPWVTTADDVEDPHDLRIRTWVNGEQVQDGRTADMITDCWAQIALLSSVFTLEPGDLISTGTPPGAAQQSADPRWLRPGDRVSVAVDGLGLVDNEVVAAPETTVIDPLRPWPPSGPSPQGGSR